MNRLAPSESSYKNILKNIGMFGGAQAVSVFAALLRNKLAAEWIGAVGMGINTLFNTIATLVANLSSLGLSFSAIRTLSNDYASGDNERLQSATNRLRLLALLTAIGGCLLMLTAAPWLSLCYYEDFSHWPHFASLALLVFATIVSGLELAILKACRRTKLLSTTTILGAIISVIVVAPFFYWGGIKMVVWALVIAGLASAAQTCWIGFRVVPYQLRKDAQLTTILREARPLIVLGLAFTLSGVIASGIELLIQSYLTTVASLSVVGLYKAGFQMSITYTGMVFTAIGNDFYPRLSVVQHDIEQRNIVIRRQIVMMLLIVVPVIAVFEWLVPYLLPLLFSQEFIVIEQMVRWAVLAILFKSISMPLGFLPLALGRSKDFLLLELVNWTLLGAGVILGYHYAQLEGAGIAIVLCHMVETIFVVLFCRHQYQFR